MLFGEPAASAAQPEYREGLDGRKRKVKAKKKKKAAEDEPDVNPFGACDGESECDASETMVGEPTTALTAPQFAELPAINAWGREIDRLLKQALRLCDSACAHASATFIETSIKNAKTALLKAKPYAHCHDCHGTAEREDGKPCTRCKMSGIITKKQHEALLKDEQAALPNHLRDSVFHQPQPPTKTPDTETDTEAAH